MPLSLATFNVKDLLEPASEPARAVFRDKLEWIARTLHACNADVVGLQEIGSAALLGQLLDRLPARGGYGTLVMGTTDARGIGCALVSRVPVLEQRVHTAEALSFPVFREGDAPPFGTRIPLRRGVVHARVAAPGVGSVDILVAHFKSSRPVPARDASGAELTARTPRTRSEGRVRSVVWRTAEALYVRGLVDAVLAERPGAHVAAVGDFNDVADSPALVALRGDGDGALLDCAASVDPAARFSCMHDGRRVQIDHLLATAGLHALLRDARFLTGGLRAHPPASGATPNAPEAAPTIDSDHAPLVAAFG